MMTDMITGFHGIVPAGGAGTRLWPLSRAGHPKFLLDLTGSGRSLIQETVDRLTPVAESVTVVTGTAHVAAVAGQLPEVDASRLLAEPSPRDSTAAICLAAAVIGRRHPGAVVGSFAADQVIRDVPAFHAAVAEAVAAARAGNLVTIGVTPTHPSTAFGYIRPGGSLGVDGAPSALRVVEFVEKPDEATATGYLAQGYRWNAGMFVAEAAVMLDLLKGNRPQLHEGIAELARVWDTDRRDAALAEVWPQLEKIAVDYAIAEPAAAAGQVAVVPASLGWDDIGDFAALATLLPPGSAIRVLGDAAQVLGVDATGVAVPAGGRLIAVLGLDDVVVVDTPDAVLVTTRAHAQKVKDVVAALKESGRTDLL